jgi:hypothetical protein
MAIVRCSQGHVNDSAATLCAMCGEPLAPGRAPSAGAAPEGAAQAPHPGPAAKVGTSAWARRWRTLSGTAQTLLVGSVVGVVALVLALVVFSSSPKKNGGGGNGGAPTGTLSARTTPSTTPAPRTTATNASTTTAVVTTTPAVVAQQWVSCPQPVYYSCQLPSSDWQVSETSLGIDVYSPTGSAYVGFAVTSDTTQSAVAGDINHVLNLQGVEMTSSSESGDDISFSGTHDGASIDGEIFVAPASTSTGLAIEWAPAAQWDSLKPTLDRIHASFEYTG